MWFIKVHTEAVQDDIVTVYGYLEGSYTYTSQANFQITLPSFVACDIEKNSPTVTKTPAVTQTKTYKAPQTNSSPVVTSNPTPAPTTPSLPPSVAYKGKLNDILPGIQFFVGTPQDYTSTDSYNQPQPGNKFITEFIQINNQSNIQFHYNSYDFTAVDPTGGHYKLALVSNNPSFGYGNLNAMSNISGNIVYEVPASYQASQFTIHYESYIGDTEVVTDFK